MKILYCVMLFFLSHFELWSQNEQLALMYFNKGEYEKALVSYEELFKQKPSNINYLYALIECHQKLSQFHEAQTIIESQFNKYKSPRLLIEWGYNQKLLKNDLEKEKYYNQAIKAIEDNYTNVYQIASTFEKKYELNYAIRAYQKAKEINPDANFNYNLALLYGQMGSMDKMIDYFLIEAYENSGRLSLIQNQITRFMQSGEESEFNDLLRKALITKTQKNQDIFWNQFLSWFYMQNKQYDRAFVQQKAIYKRYPESFYDIVELGEYAVADEDPIAEEIFEFVLQNASDVELIIYCQHFLLSLEIDKKQPQLHPKINNKFDQIIKQYGFNERTFDLILLQAKFLAFDMQQISKANQILNDTKDFNLSSKEMAQLKMIQADIHLLNEKFSQALLLYAQVETDMMGNDISQDANFKLAMTSYYQQDFEWALQQFKVLKAASTQLIANDALEMFLLITDNNQQDTLLLALKDYAKADFKLYQNKTKEAISMFQNIIKTYPEDDILDDVYYKLGTVYRKENDFDVAVLNYETIIKNFEDTVYKDKALHYLGEIHYLYLKDDIKAQSYYEQIIMNHPDSIHYVNAQKRYRVIRGDKNI